MDGMGVRKVKIGHTEAILFTYGHVPHAWGQHVSEIVLVPYFGNNQLAP